MKEVSLAFLISASYILSFLSVHVWDRAERVLWCMLFVCRSTLVCVFLCVCVTFYVTQHFN